LEDDWGEEPTDAPEDFLPPDADAAETGADEPSDSAAADEPIDGPADDPADDPAPDSAEVGAEPSDEPDSGAGQNTRLDETPNSEPAEGSTEEHDARATRTSRTKRKSAAKATRAKPEPNAVARVAENEMHLFSPDEIQTTPPIAPIGDDQGLLLVKAFVGISNRLFARGDAPLNWEEGVPLRPSGIGEWRLDLEGLEEPIQVELRINDEVSAAGDLITLAPGIPQSISPRFPRP